MNFKFILVVTVMSILSCNACGTARTINSIELEIEQIRLNVEIAATPEERQIGLMNRETLDPDSGMIFVFDKERAVSFWMKNTLIPLSIAYINKSGTILEIYDMTPLSLEPVKSKRSSILYALEVNQGYFTRNGISEGDTIDLKNLKSYLNSSN